jgi:hypothetical protein
MINNVFYKFPKEKIQRSQIWKMREPRNGSLSSYPMAREVPVQKGTNMTGTS